MKSKSSSKSSAREKGRARLDAYRMRKKNSSAASATETTTRRRTTSSSAADDTSGVVEKREVEEMRGGKTKEEEKEEVKEVKEEATERRPLPPPPLPPPSRVEEKEVKEAHRPTFPASPSSPPVSDQSFANVREAASASASVKEKENEEQLHLLREHERLQKRALEEREEELEALRGRLIETNEMLSEERLRAEEMRETMKRVELRATTAEETLRAYASVVPEATTTAKKESVEEKEKEEEHLIEIAQRRDENEHDVSERDVLKSARDAMRRERDQAIAKQRVAENKALEFEEELRDAEYTIMVLRQDVKAAEEQQRQDENEQGNDDDEEEEFRNEKQTKAEAALITELNSERRKNERLAEALHQSKEEISVLQQVSEKTKSMADKVETEADELENAIVAGEEKTRKLAKSLLEERRKVKNLRETVDIVARLVEKMTKLETDDVEGEDDADEIATNFVTESPFLRSRKTKSRLTNEEVLEESLREEDEMFDDETFFEKTIERVKNALDYKIDHLESFACEHVDKAKELGVLLTEADDEIVAQQEVVEQLQLQRDALLEEIYSRDEYLDSIERDLDQMLQTEGKLREEVSSKEKLVSEETAKNDKLMTLIEEQAMWTSSLNTKNGRDKENVDPSSSHEALDNDDDTQNDTERDRFERVKRDTDLILNYSKSAPTTPAKTRRIRSSNKNGINIAKDVYAPLLVTIEKRLHQLKDDRRKLAAFGGASLKQDHRESI